MEFNLELKKHFETGYSMPRFYHLVYYNFEGNTHETVQKIMLLNYKVFQPIYKKLKKLRNRNPFPFELNISFINKMIEEIERNNIDKSTYKFKRREFKKLRNGIFYKLYQTQKCCLYCGTEDNLSVDHILALYNGGSNHINNMQILCRSCNSSKGTKIINNN